MLCYKFCQDIFIIKKLFYNVIQTSSDMLYFPIVNVIAEASGWYRCQNRIEKCYQYYWEQLTFYQKIQIKTQRLRKEEFI